MSWEGETGQEGGTATQARTWIRVNDHPAGRPSGLIKSRKFDSLSASLTCSAHERRK